MDMETAKKRIVWVEDDKLLGSLLAQKLAAAGFDLFCATSGKEALQSLDSLSAAPPDLIMVDLILPDMNGFDILERINKDSRFAAVPRMVLSNLDAAVDQKRAHLLGAKKFLVKALTSLDQIVAEVRSAM
jgi:DNA-binding response OmpR family regulator